MASRLKRVRISNSEISDINARSMESIPLKVSRNEHFRKATSALNLNSTSKKLKIDFVYTEFSSI